MNFFGSGDSDMEPSKSKYVMGVDVGTTNIKCHIYNSKADIIGEAHLKLKCIYPKPGWVEIDPEELWNCFKQVVKNALSDSNIKWDSIECMGISTQRSTVVTWNKLTGDPYHNFIAWNDIRCDEICKIWNRSLTMKAMRAVMGLMYHLTRNYRYLSGRVYKLKSQMVVSKLLWIFEHIPKAKKDAYTGELLMGTVDTWLLWKLTQGEVHATDGSCSCVTGLYDPYLNRWSILPKFIFNIPDSILPEVRDTSGYFGSSHPDIFGGPIKIAALVGDQQASTFGECCFQAGNVKCTLGTGTFIDINTGSMPHRIFKVVYPLVGWSINGQVTYLVEGGSNDAGTAISWAQNLDFFKDPKETSSIAQSVPDSGGLYFVPAFFGLQAPVSDNTATSAFIGIHVDTTKAHMVRAILESLAFVVKEIVDIMDKETAFKINLFRVNGGVAENDFLLQLIADLTGLPVERPIHKETSCLGAALLAGLAFNYWSGLSELETLRKVDKLFVPNTDAQYDANLKQWRNALKRCLHWSQR